jgi:hypothetical protein
MNLYPSTKLTLPPAESEHPETEINPLNSNKDYENNILKKDF